ncbi:MAG TPA: NUDIX domain-containing protein [Candidatus Nanoarchaeia archaeon]|nr:NUDIX domain-containing protein [Candidatus Nanoarchaeia archaeon]
MQVTIVDESGNAIGSAKEEDIYALKLSHRVMHILAVNEKGELFLPQLSALEKFCPGHWCTSAHGIVREGESFEDAAKRELKDWLGLDVPLTLVHEGTYDHYKLRKFVQVFRCNTNNILLNPYKAITGKWFSIKDANEMVKKNQMVHPELAYVVEELYP